MTKDKDQLLEEVRLQGDHVRKLKSNKAPKEEVRKDINFVLLSHGIEE